MNNLSEINLEPMIVCDILRQIYHEYYMPSNICRTVKYLSTLYDATC